MRAASEELARTGDVHSSGSAERTARPMRSTRRIMAVLVAFGVVVALAGGWVVDAYGSLGPTPARNMLTRQAGLSQIALTVGAPSGATQALMLRVTDVSGAPVRGARLECGLTMPGMEMSLAPIVATATNQPGIYRCLSPTLDAGAWSLALTLALPSGETDHTTFTFNVT